ncbi:MAG: hypothetical protein N3B21_02910 [Clostridia bacterium]|nr:hypothetical protein [Clostridia bacterium]
MKRIVPILICFILAILLITPQSYPIHAENNNPSYEKIINIANSDKIVIVGDSYSASHFTLKGKAYISTLSLLSSYNWENYSTSGNDYQEMNNDVRSNKPKYHNKLSIKDYNGKYAVLVSNENDAPYITANEDYYYDNLRGLIETVKSLGMQPIVCTEYGEAGVGEQRNLRGLKAVADEYNCMFIDMSTKSRLFNQTQYLPFWGKSHPGTRTAYMLADSMKKYTDTLPAPKQSLKIFRKRDEFKTLSIDELLFDSIEERAEKFSEIMVGHHALGDSVKQYYDSLDVNNNSTQIISEYLKLQNKESVSFNDYALVEVVTPATSRSIKSFTLHLSDGSVQVYGRHMFTPPYEDDGKYQTFIYQGNPNVTVGDVYKSNDTKNFGSQTFVIKGKANGMIITSAPFKQYNKGPGKLVKQSGKGDDEVNYSNTQYGFSPEWYAQYGKPEGKFVAISGVNGVYRISEGNMKNFMNYDKFTFLLYKKGGFSLNDIYAKWIGEEDKVYTSKPMDKEAESPELLKETRIGNVKELSSWTVAGGMKPFVPADKVLPYGTSGCVEVTKNDYISQNVLYTEEHEKTREMQIKVWCRRFPQIFNPNNSFGTAPINLESFDMAALNIEVSSIDNKMPVRFSKLVGLHWNEVMVNVLLPTFTSAQKIKLYSKDKNIQIAKVSAKILE